MHETIALARHILDEHHKYYTKNGIDDAEMAHELKFILEGVKNYPKRCIKSEADMLKNPAKAIKFYFILIHMTTPPLFPP